MQKHYNLAVDFLRILAILAVVMIHTTILLIQTAHHDIATIPFTFFLNQMAIFAVPLFFLISGFVLELNYKNLDYKTYFKKRASRIIIPYVFWSFFYFLAFPATIPPHTSFLLLLLTGNTAYQLYFIPAIIVLYICFPVLHRYYSILSQKKVIIPCILIEILLQRVDYFFGPFPIGSVLRVTLLSFVLFPLGTIAAHHEEKIVSFTKKYFQEITCGVIFLAILIAFQGWYLYAVSKNLQAIYSQYNVFVIPYTLLIAVTFFCIFSNKEKYKNVLMKLSKLSFFVFFIHVAIIYMFWDYFKPFFLETQSSFVNNALFSLFFFLFVTMMSFLIADLFHRIPKLTRLTG